MKTFELIAEQNSPADEKLTIHEVLISVGQKVVLDQPLFLAEGAKSLFDITFEDKSGIIESICVQDGDEVEIGFVLCTFRKESI